MTKAEFDRLSKKMTPAEKRAFAISVAQDDANQAMVRHAEDMKRRDQNHEKYETNGK